MYITNIVYTNAHNPHISLMVYTMFPEVYYMLGVQYRIKDCVGPSLHGYVHYGYYVILAKKNSYNKYFTYVPRYFSHSKCIMILYTIHST